MTRRDLALASLLLLASIGCQRDVPVSTAAAGVAPLSGLAGVRLGMRADELAALRPAATTASYYGFQERLGQREVMYEVPGSVNVSEVLAAGALPLERWRAEVRRVAAAVGAEPACHVLRWPVGTAWLALWSRDDVDLFVQGQPLVRDVAGDSTPARVTIGITRAGKATERYSQWAHATPCAEITAPAG